MHYSALTHLLYNWKFVFLEYLHYFAQIPPFASGNHKSILYISECVCFQIPYISEAHHTVFVFLWCISLSIMSLRGFLHSSVSKESICNAGGPGSIPGSGRSPRKENLTTHSIILVWEIPWTEEPGRLQSMGLQEADTTEQLNHHYWCPQSPSTLFQMARFLSFFYG